MFASYVSRIFFFFFEFEAWRNSLALGSMQCLIRVFEETSTRRRVWFACFSFGEVLLLVHENLALNTGEQWNKWSHLIPSFSLSLSLLLRACARSPMWRGCAAQASDWRMYISVGHAFLLRHMYIYTYIYIYTRICIVHVSVFLRLSRNAPVGLVTCQSAQVCVKVLLPSYMV